MKGRKKTILLSLLSLLMCVSMFIGTTFAWFTDTASSAINKIVAGNLDIDVEYMNDNNNGWTSLQNSNSVFSKGFWEAGHTEFATMKVTNKGSLALKYQMNVSPITEKGGINVKGESFKMSDYLVFGTTEPKESQTVYTRETARAAVGTTMGLTPTNLTKNSTLEAGKVAYITLVVYMPESVGNEANYKTGTTAPEIELGIRFVATQLNSENDSFGPDYDNNVEYPTINTVITYNYFPQTNQVAQLKSDGNVAVKDGDDNHVVVENNTITIKSDAKLNNTSSSFAELAFENSNIEFENPGAEAKATVVFNAEKKEEGNFTYDNGADGESIKFEISATVAGGNFKAGADGKFANVVKVKLFIGEGKQNVSLTHSGATMTKVASIIEVDAADEYYYDSTTGYITMAVSHFSEFEASYYAPVAAVGTTAYYSVERAAENAGEGTVSLIRDVKENVEVGNINLNLNGKKIENLTVTGSAVIDDGSVDKSGTITNITVTGEGSAVATEGTVENDVNGNVGFTGVKEDDTTVYEAQVGEIKFKTLQGAVKAAKDDDIVTMLNDVAIATTSDSKIGLTISKSITLDGANKSLTITGKFAGDSYGIFVQSGSEINVTVENLNLVTTGMERAIRFEGQAGGTLQDMTISGNGVGVHVKGTGEVEMNRLTVNITTETEKFTAHKRSGVVVGAETTATLKDSSVTVTAVDKSESNTNTWGKGLYVGYAAKGKLVVENTTVKADFALAIDGTEDSTELNNITVNSGTFDGALGSPGGYRYKEIVINGGTFTNYSYASNVFNSKTDKIARLEIFGGTFNVSPDAKFIAENCVIEEIVENEKTWYKIIKLDPTLDLTNEVASQYIKKVELEGGDLVDWVVIENKNWNINGNAISIKESFTTICIKDCNITCGTLISMTAANTIVLENCDITISDNGKLVELIDDYPAQVWIVGEVTVNGVVLTEENCGMGTELFNKYFVGVGTCFFD